MGDTWHWQAEDFPASEISLRTAMTENFLINDITDPARVRVIGEMDRFTVPMLLHENAIYLHEGVQYQVERLDYDACKAFVRRVEVDYYTDADLNVSLSLLDIAEEGADAAWGEVKVTAITKLFKFVEVGRELANINGMPAKLLNTPEEVYTMQQAEQQAQMAQAAIAAAPAMTQSVKDVAEAGKIEAEAANIQQQGAMQ